MRTWLSDTAAALSFFTRWPLPDAAHATPLATAARAVPVAAFIAALPSALALVIFSGVDPLLAAIAATAVMAIVTGALHEDGFADVADGFWGGATPEGRLDIMRDSRLGTFGVVALVLALTAKVALLSALLRHGVVLAAASLIGAAVMARTAALFVWISEPPARADGLAAAAPTEVSFQAAALLATVIATVLLFWQSELGLVLATLLVLLSAKGISLLARAKIGGVTGDVIGAAIVTADLAFLFAMVIWMGAPAPR